MRLVFALTIVCACSSRHVRYPASALIAKSVLDLAARPLSAAQSKVFDDANFVIVDDAKPQSFFLG